MTALCGGGSSGPKPGVNETIIYSTGALASMLNNKGGAWAVLVAPLLGVLAYSATGLCTADPPPEPTISASEYQALLNLGPWDELQVAMGKLSDLIKIAVWHEMCACTSGSTPVAPPDLFTPPTAVTLPIPNGACPQPSVRVNPGYKPTVGAWQQSNNITAQLFPELQVLQSVADANAAQQDIVAWPSDWLGYRTITDWVASDGTAGLTSESEILLFGANRVFVGRWTISTISAANPHAVNPPTGFQALNRVSYPYFAVSTEQASGGTGLSTIDIRLEADCYSGGAPISTCCPPDPAVLGMLQQLLTAATLQQRWRLPFATIDGSTTPASGTGSFAIARAVGLRIEVVTEPPGTRTSFGNPPYHFDLGWLSVSDGGGMLQELRVTRPVQTWFPAQMQLATLVGYALRGGVAAYITELLVEP